MAERSGVERTAMQRSIGIQYAVLDEKGTIVDMNRAFSLALDEKAVMGDPLHAVEHPLAAALRDAFAQGEDAGFRIGRYAYELLRSDAGGTVLLGRPLMGPRDELTYDALFLKASVPLLLLDPSEYTMVDANLAASRFFGRPREQLCGMHAAELLGERLDPLMTEEGRFLARCRMASGDEAEVQVEHHPVIMDDQELVLAMVRTPEDSAGEQVLQSERRYRALSDAAFEGIIIHSNNIIMECNQTFAEMTGLPRERVIGANLMELIKADSRELVMRQVAGGRHDPYEVSISSGDGTFRLMVVRGREIMYEGRPARVAALLDITERERASTRLEKERAMLRAIMDSLPVGVIITDALGGFTEINEMASAIWGGPIYADDMFGYDRFVAFGQETGEAVRPEDWGIVRALLHGETSVGDLYDIVRFDGGRRSVVISTAPVKGADGEVLGSVEVTQDITHQKELERRASIAKGEAELYLDVLTHDIANFNTALMGNLELMRHGRCVDRHAAPYVDKCLGVLQASNELISAIQQVQRAGEARERRDLGEMLHAVAGELSIPFDRKVHLEQDIEEGLVIECNSLLREAFVNLLNNAIVHTSGEVHIWIRARRVDDRAIVSVENDGDGIEDAIKARLFDRRVRGSGKVPGQGLGLFLMRTLVEGHGGNVMVDDRMAGGITKGVRFVVSLPLARSQGQ